MSSLKAERIAQITFWIKITAWHKMSQLYNIDQWPRAALLKFGLGLFGNFTRFRSLMESGKSLKAVEDSLNASCCNVLSALYW